MPKKSNSHHDAAGEESDAHFPAAGISPIMTSSAASAAASRSSTTPTNNKHHRHHHRHQYTTSQNHSLNAPPHWKLQLHEFFENPSSSVMAKCFHLIQSLIIIISAFCLCISTFQSFMKYEWVFFFIESPMALFFTAEYLCRWIVFLLDSDSYTRTFKRNPLKASFHFVFNWWNLIDLAAFLPFWIDSILLLGGITVYIEHFAIFRILRLIRIFKMFSFGVRVSLLIKAIKINLNLLFSVLCISMMSIVIFSTFIYFAEYNEQPEIFSSIPEVFWFAIATSSTTGYGDMVPITPLGKAISALLIAIGALTLTLPSVIVSSTFASLSYQYDMSRKRRKQILKQRKYARETGSPSSEDEFPSSPLPPTSNELTMATAGAASQILEDSSPYQNASREELIHLLKKKDSLLSNQITLMQKATKELLDTRHLLQATLSKIDTSSELQESEMEDNVA